MTEKTHKVLGRRDEISAGFSGPEIMQGEPVSGKVMFEFFDAVLRAGPSPTGVICHTGGKRKIGDTATVAVIARFFITGKQFRLLDFLPARLWTLLYLPTYRNGATRGLPVLCLKSRFRNINTVRHLRPRLLMNRCILEAARKTAGNDMRERFPSGQSNISLL
jgi:hypothetical protein